MSQRPLLEWTKAHCPAELLRGSVPLGSAVVATDERTLEASSSRLDNDEPQVGCHLLEVAPAIKPKLLEESPGGQDCEVTPLARHRPGPPSREPSVASPSHRGGGRLQDSDPRSSGMR